MCSSDLNATIGPNHVRLKLSNHWINRATLPSGAAFPQAEARRYLRALEFCKVSAHFRVFMKDHDRQSKFEQLVRDWGPDLFRYAYWLCGHEALARDLVQETFLRAWKALDRLQDVGAIKSWLITILRREYARTFERKVPPLVSVDSVILSDEDGLGPEEKAERHRLREGIAALPKKYREPLLLQVVMGYSCEEIANTLAINRNAVMTQLHRAREKLKTQLREDGVTGNIHGIF